MDTMEEASPSRPSLKGYKLVAKDFKRNILLKYKSNKKNYRSDLSLQSISPQKLTTNIAYKSFSSINEQRLSHSKLNLLEFSPARLYSEVDLQSLNYTLPQSSDKRMQQYLNVVFKKVEKDTDKIMKAISVQKDLKKTPRSRNRQPVSVNYLKKFKLNSIKMRLKKERQEAFSSMQKKIDVSVTQAQNILQKIRKTQDFAHSQKKNRQEDKKNQRFHKTQLIGIQKPKKPLASSIRKLSQK